MLGFIYQVYLFNFKNIFVQYILNMLFPSPNFLQILPASTHAQVYPHSIFKKQN